MKKLFHIKKYLQAKPKTFIGMLTSILLLCIYYYIIVKYTINFPFFDDYHAVLEFLIKYTQEATLGGKIKLLFSQHNEHRILFERLVVVAQFSIFHKVDFTTLTLIGNLSIAIIVVLLFKSIVSINEKNILYFLPMIFIVVNFHYYNISFWAMGSLQNLWVLALGITALYLLMQATRISFLLAILVGLFSVYSSGNGMMVFIAGTIALFLKDGINKKLLTWTLIGLLGIIAYFYGYYKSESVDILTIVKEDPLSIILYFFTLVGSCFPIVAHQPSWLYSCFLGIFIVLFIVFIFIKNYHKKNPAIFSIIIFLLLTAAIVTMGRIGFGIEQALSSRYTIISSICFACCYISFVELYYDSLKNRYALWIFLFISILSFHFSTYYEFLPIAIDDKIEYDNKTSLLKKGIYANLSLGWPLPDKTEPKRVLHLTDSIGIYSFNYNCDFPIDSLPICTSCQTFNGQDIYRTEKDKIEIFGWAFVKNVNSDSIITKVQLIDSNGILARTGPCENQRRKDVTLYYKDDQINYNSSGFFCECTLKNIKKGNYKITILLANRKYKVNVYTGKDVIVN